MTRRVGIVYDGSVRDNGTPLLYRLAMTKVLGEEPVWATEAAPIRTRVDWWIHIDDGRDDLSVEGIPKPWAYLAIDTHLGLQARLRKASQADLVWVAQKPAVEEFARHGIEARWLPLACEPLLHPLPTEMLDSHKQAPVQYDLAFVGYLQNPVQSTRISFLDGLFSAFPSSHLSVGYFHRDMAAAYHRARIGVNHAIRTDLNMRFFELASVGVPQLADSRMEGLADLGFKPFVHYIPYDSGPKAIEWVGEYLANRRYELPVLAKAAYTHVRAHHTYEHRVRTMLSDLEAHDA